MLTAQIALVDIIIELLDARIPRSSQNPDLGALAKNKKRVVVLNKADLADASITNAWVRHFEAQGFLVCAINSTGPKRKDGLKRLETIALEHIKRRKTQTRAMVCGIPNVGKSTLINALSGRSAAKVENRPAVTRGRQWIRAAGFELMDTPGILWPRSDDAHVAQNLAFTGAIIDRVLDNEELAQHLLGVLVQRAPKSLAARYGDVFGGDTADALASIATKKGHKKKGGALDTQRTAFMILGDFRSGNLGRISLETPTY